MGTVDPKTGVTQRAPNDLQAETTPTRRPELHLTAAPAEKKEVDRIFHSLIASDGKLIRHNHWATVGSLVLQVMFMTGLCILPLYRIGPLPKKETVTVVRLEAPVSAPPRIAQLKAPPKHSLMRALAKPVISAPSRPPQEAPTPPSTMTSDLTAGTLDGSSNGGPSGATGFPREEPVPAKTPPPTPVKRIRVAAGTAQANLIYDVPPQYPAEAGRERVEGSVVLLAVIGTDGTVKEVQVESGPPQLTQAAVEAVKQWRYKPFLVNGSPVEIDSRITINFTLSRG